MSYSVRQYPASSANYDTSRRPIKKIIIHHAASTSFESIGQVFSNPSRGASAHYGVGRNNNVDQYVPEKFTAWHCGNYPVNQESIGIENVNSAGAPSWEVAPETKNTLVELVTDICRRNPSIGRLQHGVNLFGHKEVASPGRETACPVTLIAFLPELAQRVNANLDGGSTPTPSPTPGKKSNEQVADEVLAGAWGNNPHRRDALIAAGYDYNAIQAIVNARLGNPTSAPRKGNDVIANEVIAGAWGNGVDRQNRLTAAGYDYRTIQNIVNQKVGAGPAPSQPSRLSNDEVANQVLAGAWGNGDDRRNRLVAAGYDYNAVQSLVNQKLGMGAPAPARKSNDQVANEVLAGNWGNGQERKDRLAAAGYDYGTIQSIVNRKLGL